MPIISIQIEVLNPKELVEKKKGKVAKWMATIFMSEKALKRKVEEQVSAEVVKTLQQTLSLKLKEEGIESKINISLNKDPDVEQI